MSVLVTGSAGFIGSNFVRLLIDATGEHIVSLDALTYAGNMDNLANLPSDRHAFIHGNICDEQTLTQVFRDHAIEKVVHFAAESHVDRSIMSSDPFIQTNVVGTQRLLDASKTHGVEAFVHVSTDEVYGTLNATEPAFTEGHHIQPNSPYSASKAASDLLVRSYVETFGFPAMITRCSNNYGPYQFPEKLIPLMIHNAKNNRPLPVYGDGTNIRDWIHVSDHCKGVLRVLEKGEFGEVYNIGGHSELKNIDIVHQIIDACGADSSLIQFVSDRPGHDFRYAMDISKIEQALGWAPEVSFSDGLSSTIQWYADNSAWLEKIINGDYQNYYKEQYQ
jgi:dTDP-glucose 4,6-dehydratase